MHPKALEKLLVDVRVERTRLCKGMAGRSGTVTAQGAHGLAEQTLGGTHRNIWYNERGFV